MSSGMREEVGGDVQKLPERDVAVLRLAMRGRLTSGPAPLSSGERRKWRPLGTRRTDDQVWHVESGSGTASMLPRRAERNARRHCLAQIRQNRASLGHSQFLGTGNTAMMLETEVFEIEPDITVISCAGRFTLGTQLRLTESMINTLLQKGVAQAGSGPDAHRDRGQRRAGRSDARVRRNGTAWRDHAGGRSQRTGDQHVSRHPHRRNPGAGSRPDEQREETEGSTGRELQRTRTVTAKPALESEMPGAAHLQVCI